MFVVFVDLIIVGIAAAAAVALKHGAVHGTSCEAFVSSPRLRP